MVTGTLRKDGNEWVVVVPDEEIARLGLDEGQQVNVELTPTLDKAVDLDPKIKAIATKIIREQREALDYLAR